MSQITPNDKIVDLVSAYNKDSLTVDNLVELRDIMYDNLEILDYNESTKTKEAEIRWKRTAAQIVNDGYVYEGKSCTDLVVVFLSLCEAIGLETYFVKLKKKDSGMVHSVTQVRIGNDWYIFDVTNKNSKPETTDISKDKEGREYKNGWILWKKGKDSWDLGLREFNDITKIQVN